MTSLLSRLVLPLALLLPTACVAGISASPDEEAEPEGEGGSAGSAGTGGGAGTAGTSGGSGAAGKGGSGGTAGAAGSGGGAAGSGNGGTGGGGAGASGNAGSGAAGGSAGKGGSGTGGGGTAGKGGSTAGSGGSAAGSGGSAAGSGGSTAGSGGSAAGSGGNAAGSGGSTAGSGGSTAGSGGSAAGSGGSAAGSGGSAAGSAGATSACPGTPLAVDVGTPATYSGKTDGAPSDLSATCSSSKAPNVVLEVTPAKAGRLTATVDPATGFDASLYARATCGSGADLACAEDGFSGEVETIELDVEAGTPVYVVVDGYSGDSGAFSATMTLKERPKNDTCQTAEALDLVAGTPLVVKASTAAAKDSGHGSCGGSSAVPDVFYSITPPVSGNLALTLQPASGFDTVLYVYEGTCGASASEVDCDDATGSSAESLTIPVTAGKTYYVVADGYSSGKTGDFTLTATLIGAPTNDTCATATAIALDPGSQVINGTTTAAVNDYAGSCGASSTGEDVVYVVTPSASGKLTATLNPASGFDSVLFAYKDACGVSANIVACKDEAGSTTDEVISFAVTAGTPYWVVVDGYNAQDGTYALTLDLAEAPANDKCANAAAIAVSVGSPVTLNGDTTNATNDDTGVCSGGSTGPDVAYAITPATSGSLKIDVDSPGALDPVLYAGATTCGSTSQTCKDQTGASGTETLTMTVVGGQTYWAIVDGYKGTKGPFTLTVTLN